MRIRPFVWCITPIYQQYNIAPFNIFWGSRVVTNSANRIEPTTSVVTGADVNFEQWSYHCHTLTAQWNSPITGPNLVKYYSESQIWISNWELSVNYDIISSLDTIGRFVMCVGGNRSPRRKPTLSERVAHSIAWGMRLTGISNPRPQTWPALMLMLKSQIYTRPFMCVQDNIHAKSSKTTGYFYLNILFQFFIWTKFEQQIKKREKNPHYLKQHYIIVTLTSRRAQKKDGVKGRIKP
jgi:hypothetical protein